MTSFRQACSAIPNTRLYALFTDWMRQRGYDERIVTKVVLDYRDMELHPDKDELSGWSSLHSKMLFELEKHGKGDTVFPEQVTIHYIDVIPTDLNMEPLDSVPFTASALQQLTTHFANSFGIDVTIDYTPIHLSYADTFGPITAGPVYTETQYADGVKMALDAPKFDLWVKDVFNPQFYADKPYANDPGYNDFVRFPVKTIDGLPAHLLGRIVGRQHPEYNNAVFVTQAGAEDPLAKFTALNSGEQPLALVPYTQSYTCENGQSSVAHKGHVYWLEPGESYKHSISLEPHGACGEVQLASFATPSNLFEQKDTIPSYTLKRNTHRSYDNRRMRPQRLKIDINEQYNFRDHFKQYRRK